MHASAPQIPVYDHVKHTILNNGLMTEGVRLHIFSSMVAGFVTALTTSPVDVVKTRIMNQKAKGQPPRCTYLGYCRFSWHWYLSLKFIWSVISVNYLHRYYWNGAWLFFYKNIILIYPYCVIKKLGMWWEVIRSLAKPTMNFLHISNRNSLKVFPFKL